MKKTIPIWRQLLVLAVLIAAGVGMWIERDRLTELASAYKSSTPHTSGKKAKRNGPPAVPVIVARVETKTNEEIITAVGTARARKSVMIFSKTDGVIVSFVPRPGDEVLSGETIFELDSTQAKLAVEIASKRAQEATRLFERSEILKKRNINSSAKVVDARVVAERAALELRQAQERLSDLTISAPFTGVLGLPKMETGERVTSTQAIVSLDQRDTLLVEFEVPERYSARIKTGDVISAVTPSHEQSRFEGKIEYIDSRIDPLSRTVTVRAIIPNKKDVLRPGMSFVVELYLGGSDYAAVPELSLQWRKGESYVWIVRDGKARKVLVTTIRRLNAIVLIEGEIAPGDLVVVEGVQRLRPDRPVSYKPPEPVEKPAVSEKSATVDTRPKG